jgi:hypothetical protein
MMCCPRLSDNQTFLRRQLLGPLFKVLLNIAQSNILNVLLGVGRRVARGEVSLRLWWLVMIFWRTALSRRGIAFAPGSHTRHNSQTFCRRDSLTWQGGSYRTRECLLFYSLDFRWMLHKIWRDCVLRIVKIWKIFSEGSQSDATPW